MNNQLKDDIIKLLQNRKILADSGNWKNLTYLRCGGNIAVVANCRTVEQLMTVLEVIKKHNLSYYVVGNGSKLLASDDFFDGVVINMRHLTGVEILGTTVNACAGSNTATIARLLADNGLDGGQFLYCLPATIGGAVVMNAGCYGGCLSDIVKTVTCYDCMQSEMVTLNNEQCCFALRDSIFRSGRYIVTNVQMQLHNGDKCSIIETMKGLLAKKQQSQPLNKPTAGSTFFSSEIVASKAIDEAGLKGKAIGGACVSSKHAGFIVNENNATFSEIKGLIELIAHTIKEKCGIILHQEIVEVTPQQMYDSTRGLPHTHNK